MSLLSRLGLTSAATSVAPSSVMPTDIDGVPVRVSVRAKRMALRQDTRTGRVVLTLPRRKTWTAKADAAVRAFVAQNRDWILRHEQPPQDGSAAAVPGGVLSVLGQDYTLVHQPGRGLGGIDAVTLRIVVTGGVDHFQRRLQDILKRHAQEVLTLRTHEKSARLGLPARAVRLRDPATRWGSCGSDGRIMYSWRLVLAPDWVLDYVVAHEVAHRVHMDHSRAFWRLCLSLTTRGGEARRWLNRHGAGLMRV